MHGRRGENAPTIAGGVHWVCTRIVQAATSREIRPCAVRPPRIRRGFGQNRALLGLRSCTCLGRDRLKIPDCLSVPSKLQMTRQ